MELADQSFADFAGRKIEAREIFVGRKAGGLHVTGDETHLAFCHFSFEQL